MRSPKLSPKQHSPLLRRRKTRTRSLWTILGVAALISLTTLLSLKHSTEGEKVLQENPFSHIERPECLVTPRVVFPQDYDAAKPQGEVPQHVREFDQKEYKLPKYPSSEMLMVSVSSNTSYSRRIAQENTIGRIFDIEYVMPTDVPACVLCEQADQSDACHCPPYRTPCYKFIFFDKSDGWWCAARRDIFGIKVALDRRGDESLPKWMHVMEDQTFVNPIGMMLLVSQLDPDVPYWIGDDWGGFGGGGCGRLASRGLLKLLLGRPMSPGVRRVWPNGTLLVQPSTQVEACFERQQGGDLCYQHADWAASTCVREVGVELTDLGLKDHRGFFSQWPIKNISATQVNWFQLKDGNLARALRKTHTIAMHVSIDSMYELFYETIVPYYAKFYRFS